MAGLRPWKAPRPAKESQGQVSLTVSSRDLTPASNNPRPPTCAARWTPVPSTGMTTWAPCSRVAIRVRRAVAALEPHLVRTMRLRPLDEELVVEGDAAGGVGVELHHPALDA